MSKPPILSIVTIVYNGVNELQQTIDSVSKVKKGDDVEFVIIDGGSKDGTIGIIEKNSTVIDKFISESDNGIYDAMNKGIDLAAGAYVVFMNAGDCFNSRLETLSLLSQLNAEPITDIYYSDCIQKIGDKKYFIPLNDNSDNWWEKKLPCHQCCIIKGSILKTNKFSLKFSISADSELLINLFSNYKSKKYPIPIAIFEIGGLSNFWPDFKSLLKHLQQMLAVRNLSILSQYKIYVIYTIKFCLIKMLGALKYYQLSYLFKGIKQIND